MKILVTGANGFIGQALVKSLLNTPHIVIACVRQSVKPTLDCEYRFIEKLDSTTEWKQVLQDIDVIVHCAGKSSITKDELNNLSSSLHEVNTAATINLVEQAVQAGIQRFIFLSSIKVNGEYSLPNQPFIPDVSQPPTDPYGLSKYNAEIGLKEIASNSAIEYVIIRPTLVYGENVKGNFSSLMKWTYKGLPLPLGGIRKNLRSLVSVDNLTDFIINTIDNDFAKNEIFLVSDDEDISTAIMLEDIASGLEVNNRALPIPPVLIYVGASIIGKKHIARRLCGSLQVDISKSKKKLNWQPKCGTHESIKETAKSYKLNLNKNKNNPIWQRPIDFTLAASGLVVTSPLLIGTTIVGYFDTRSPLFIQERVGKDKKPFKLVKFRTMKVDTASVASHLADTSSITKLGSILRKTKLDELPQLINVLKGEMSLVGPRPNLFNQLELIEARNDKGVYNVLPGITGLAQLSGIDMSTPELLAEIDKEMIDNLTLKKYLNYIFRTALGKGSGDAVKTSTTICEK
ncbi:hybrid nucleoside-diphosphate sugar epimerase/sugar transferase [Psychrobacter sp.]|uniref:hybrid nucleoside-diphosphate sugar epimerase/sugar transferase n=1 Tax=Psychrobacter sp. TaxID=56811 RepID=UPI0025DC95EF|nr:hybrid nucleoside-diphosphate sugar epimerase/sugar transferase [Psychrobacter sp.]